MIAAVAFLVQTQTSVDFAKKQLVLTEPDEIGAKQTKAYFDLYERTKPAGISDPTKSKTHAAAFIVGQLVRVAYQHNYNGMTDLAVKDLTQAQRYGAWSKTLTNKSELSVETLELKKSSDKLLALIAKLHGEAGKLNPEMGFYFYAGTQTIDAYYFLTGSAPFRIKSIRSRVDALKAEQKPGLKLSPKLKSELALLYQANNVELYGASLNAFRYLMNDQVNGR